MTTELLEGTPEIPRSQVILKRAGWAGFGLICMIFFTIIKLPEDRLKGFIEGNLSNLLAQRGISFTSNESKISYFLGVTYSMKNVTVNLPSTTVPIHIDRLQITPSILSSIIGRFGGAFIIDNGDGNLTGSFSTKSTNIDVYFKAKKLNLGKLGVLPIAAGIQGSAILDGTGTVSGDPAVPSTLEGNINIILSKIVIDPQTISGFAIPRLGISDGVADLNIDKAKAVIKTFRLGKPGNAADDLQGTVTGDISLGRSWEASSLNLKTHFGLSESIMKAFVLLDAILGGGKQADGAYSFNISGPLENPMPTPVGPGGS
jgi:type II secretion system protein N